MSSLVFLFCDFIKNGLSSIEARKRSLNKLHPLNHWNAAFAHSYFEEPKSAVWIWITKSIQKTNTFRRKGGSNLNGFGLCLSYRILIFNASERVRWQCLFVEEKEIQWCVYKSIYFVWMYPLSFDECQKSLEFKFKKMMRLNQNSSDSIQSLREWIFHMGWILRNEVAKSRERFMRKIEKIGWWLCENEIGTELSFQKKKLIDRTFNECKINDTLNVNTSSMSYFLNDANYVGSCFCFVI